MNKKKSTVNHFLLRILNIHMEVEYQSEKLKYEKYKFKYKMNILCIHYSSNAYDMPIPRLLPPSL